MTKVVVYTKDGCHLCENVIAVLEKLAAEHPLEVSSQDITADARLFERFKDIIPVVEVDGKVRVGGSTLSNQSTLEGVLRKALFP